MLITASFGNTNTGKSVYYRLVNQDTTTAQARTNSGVVELVSGSGLYGVTVSDSTLAGKTVIWDIDGTSKTASETFALLPNSPLAEEYAADGQPVTLVQALYMLLQIAGEKTIDQNTGVMTVRRLDGTTAMTFQLDNALNPTSITRTS